MAEGGELTQREDYFCEQFTKYLLRLSDVSSDFEAGGVTKEKETKTTKITGFVSSALGGAAGYGVGKLLPSLATILMKAGYTSAGVLATEISKWKETSDERKDRRKLFVTMPQDLKGREECTEIFILAALALFRAHECQLSNVTDTIHHDWRLAMGKLAEDAADRVINHITELDMDGRKRFCQCFATSGTGSSTAFNIWGAPAAIAIYHAVLSGKSIQSLLDKARFKEGHTLIYWHGINNKERQQMETSRLFDDVGYTNKDSQGFNTFWRRKDGYSNAEYGYRRKFMFDEYFKATKYKPVDKQGKMSSLHHSFISYEYKLDLSDAKSGVERVLMHFKKDDSNLDNLCQGMTDILADIWRDLDTVNATGAETNKFVKQTDTNVKEVLAILKKVQLSEPLKDKIFSFGLPEKIVNFTGRVSKMKDLHESITRQNKDNVTVITTVSGLGGIGKTTLAIHYAWTYSVHFYRNIVWINSETSSSCRDSIMKLVDKLNIITVDRHGKAIDLLGLTELIYDRFDGEKALFIFDNVENYESIQGLLPRASPGKNPAYVLMTSRNRVWNDKVNMLELDVFTDEESLDFLTSYLGLENNSEAGYAAEISRLLQNLPLAIRQAGAYVKVQCERKKESREKQLKEYIDLFNTKKAKLLLGFRHSKQTLDPNESTTLVTWNITLKKIKKENPISKEIMQNVSFMSPNDIPIQLIEGLYKLEPKPKPWSLRTMKLIATFKKVEAAVALLSDYSMITRDDRGSFNVHRLVQRVIRLKIKERKVTGYLKTLAARIEKSLKYSTDEEYIHACFVQGENLLNHYRRELSSIDLYNHLVFVIRTRQNQAVQTQIKLVNLLIGDEQLSAGIRKSKEFRLEWRKKSHFMHMISVQSFVELLPFIASRNWLDHKLFGEFLEEASAAIKEFNGNVCNDLPGSFLESITSTTLMYANSTKTLIEFKQQQSLLTNLSVILSTYNTCLEKRCPYNRPYFVLVDSVIQTLGGTGELRNINKPEEMLGALGEQRLTLLLSLIRIIRCEALVPRTDPNGCESHQSSFRLSIPHLSQNLRRPRLRNIFLLCQIG